MKSNISPVAATVIIIAVIAVIAVVGWKMTSGQSANDAKPPIMLPPQFGSMSTKVGKPPAPGTQSGQPGKSLMPEGMVNGNSGFGSTSTQVGGNR